MSYRIRVEMLSLQQAPAIQEGGGGNKFELLDITEE